MATNINLMRAELTALLKNIELIAGQDFNVFKTMIPAEVKCWYLYPKTEEIDLFRPTITTNEYIKKQSTHGKIARFNKLINEIRNYSEDTEQSQMLLVRFAVVNGPMLIMRQIIDLVKTIRDDVHPIFEDGSRERYDSQIGVFDELTALLQRDIKTLFEKCNIPVLQELGAIKRDMAALQYYKSQQKINESYSKLEQTLELTYKKLI